MNIPIVFAFDDNLSFAASVCVSSLASSSDPETSYSIFVLYSGSQPTIYEENKLLEKYSNISIDYVNVGDMFSRAFEIRDITVPTYYRLAIPQLFPQFEKVIYADVDIIFRSDLSSIYSIDMGDNYLGATYGIEMNIDPKWKQYVSSIGVKEGEYYQAGVLLMNLSMMRKDSLVNSFIAHAEKNYKFQDQDIVNIVCKDRIIQLPFYLNMTTYSYEYLELHPDLLTQKYLNSDPVFSRCNGNIHYNGRKPWQGLCPNFDVWWECYRKSPIFDSQYYFSFFYGKLNELDQLSLWKRIKILLRYFVFGRR